MNRSTPADSRRRGDRGEECAARFLEEQGFSIVARRFRSRFGEIDLIAQRLDLLLFVEVKTRSTHTFGTGAEAVLSAKKKRIEKTALYYLATRGSGKERVRFDVIEVEPHDGKFKVRAWYRGAFYCEP